MVEDGHRIGKGAGPDLDERNQDDDGDADGDDDGADDDDGVEPVAHEVEVKGKLVGKLDSHGHLIFFDHLLRENIKGWWANCTPYS